MDAMGCATPSSSADRLQGAAGPNTMEAANTVQVAPPVSTGNEAPAGSAAGGTTAGSAAGPVPAGSVSPVAGAAGQSAAGMPAPPPLAAVGPVPMHGALHVAAGHVVDASGKPFQLRGMSLFWTQWTSLYTSDTVDQLADDWHAGLVRTALGIEKDGYLEKPAENEAKVVAVVERAIARGLYVIVDWHDHHAADNQAAATEFFTRMANQYGASPNVIFEIWNEPLAVSWESVKAYAEPVIAAIRGAGGANLILVGTPNWSQDVDAAAASPIKGVNDVAYVLHFYAATHTQWLRDRASAAVKAGLPLFVSEWGTCEATGNGMVSESETKAWLDLLAKHQISWANWALNDKAEACSALAPDAAAKGPWAAAALTPSGSLVKALLTAP
ncbi:MAG TPA: cellulase family glycosylhydrolase [Polyangiales bacterium]|nr:cellulase family glycosylhydrolase [Polyangiales bacterium]